MSVSSLMEWRFLDIIGEEFGDELLMEESYGSAMTLRKGRVFALGIADDKVSLPNPESTADNRFSLACCKLEVDPAVAQKDRTGCGEIF